MEDVKSCGHSGWKSEFEEIIALCHVLSLSSCIPRMSLGSSLENLCPCLLSGAELFEVLEGRLGGGRLPPASSSSVGPSASTLASTAV
jgi:hypothetical protein